MKKIIDGITFLKLKGNDSERARLHGKYLREEVRKGAIPHLSDKNESLIRKSPLPKLLSPFKEIGVHFYHDILLPAMERNLPEKFKEMTEALASETGLSKREILNALYQPDGLMLLSRTSIMSYTFKDLNINQFPGCSSTVVLKEWTKEGRPLMCRNQDYPIVGYWDPYPLVVFHESNETGFIPHVSVGTPGVFPSGLTSMNEEGLCLTTHAHFGKKVSIKGIPIFYVGGEVISKAKNINEAIDLIRKLPRNANWAFVLLDSKNNESCVVEMTPKEEKIRYATNGTISHTNYFHNEQLKKDEAIISGGVWSDNLHRLCRMQEQIKDYKGQITIDQLVQILGDNYDDKESVYRIVGNTLSPVTNIKSVGFDPLKQKLWISNRLESPVCWGDYMEVHKETVFKEDFKSNYLKGKRPSENMINAMKKYREAFMIYMGTDLNNYEERALTALDESLYIYSDDGNVWMVAGLVAFKMKDFKRAENYFLNAKEKKLSPHIKSVCELFLARILDVNGKRSEAVKIYEQNLNAVEPRLKNAFKDGIKRAYSKNRAGTLAVDLQFPDVHHY